MVKSTRLRHRWTAAHADLLIHWLSMQLLGTQPWHRAKPEAPMDVEDRVGPVQVPRTGGVTQQLKGPLAG